MSKLQIPRLKPRVSQMSKLQLAPLRGADPDLTVDGYEVAAISLVPPPSFFELESQDLRLTTRVFENGKGGAK